MKQQIAWSQVPYRSGESEKKINHKYDHFDLKVSLKASSVQDDESPVPAFLITQTVLINGECLASENPIDLRQLAKSCQVSGEFYIVTCGCGDAGCAGILDGVRVSHFPDRICWEVPEPISASKLTEDESEQQHHKSTFRKYTFEPISYLHAVQAGLREARRMLFGERQPVECSPYGFDPDDLLDLDPIVFSKRGASLGCRIVGKKISIEDTPGHVTINGILYRLSELPLPDAIKQLDDWSAWEPKPCGEGFAYNYAAAPDWEVRRRMKLLGDHLAQIVMKGSDVVITLRNDWKNKRRHQLVLGGRAR